MAEISSHPLIFLVDVVTPRIAYVFQTIFGEMLDMKYEIQSLTEIRPDAPIPYFNYSHKFLNNILQFPCEGLLQENDIRNKDAPVPPWPLSDTPDDIGLEHDPFAYFFYHITEYKRLQNPEYDTHGRHISSEVRPRLERLLSYLDGLFGYYYDSVNPPRQRAKFDFEITIDVDHPWKFRHKPASITLGGGLKDLVKGRFRTLAERIRFLSRGLEPFDVFSQIRRICPADKTTLFFLVDGNHPNDSRFSLRLPAYQQLVRQYLSVGYRIGLHPSYESFQDEGRIRSEKQLLEKVVGPVTHSRQHYLRYRLPYTFQFLEKSGISHEYSSCPPATCGTTSGLLRPYKWFDLARNAVSELTLVPACVMDRTLQQYMELSPDAAFQEIKDWIDTTRRFGGKFVFILHNETFSESGEWRGWRRVIEETVAYLQKDES